jgi:hypothetical protein
MSLFSWLAVRSSNGFGGGYHSASSLRTPSDEMVAIRARSDDGMLSRNVDIVSGWKRY